LTSPAGSDHQVNGSVFGRKRYCGNRKGRRAKIRKNSYADAMEEDTGGLPDIFSTPVW
jgi:hypothetical protein